MHDQLALSIAPQNVGPVLNTLTQAGLASRVEALVPLHPQVDLRAVDPPFSSRHLVEIAGIGRCQVCGSGLAHDLAHQGEALTDALRRRGFGSRGCQEVVADGRSGSVILFVESEALGRTGLRHRFEADPGSRIVETMPSPPRFGSRRSTGSTLETTPGRDGAGVRPQPNGVQRC
jgi:hypothetical protein